MRIGIVVGVVLMAVGLYVVAGRATYSSKREVLKIGELKASVDEEHSIPKWTGVLAVAVGAVLLFAGARRKS